MAMVSVKPEDRIKHERTGCPTRPSRTRECQTTRVAKALLRLASDASQWERTYDVLAWAHHQVLNGQTRASDTSYNKEAISAARSVADAEANVRRTELESYLSCTLGQVADRLL